MKRFIAIALCLVLLTAQIPAVYGAGETSGTLPKKDGFGLATVRYEFSDGSYGFAEVTETESGYAYRFSKPAQPFKVIPEYYSLTVWDGAVDISWYDPAQTSFALDNPAQLAGLAALVNGNPDADTPDYRIKGDRSLLVSTKIDDFLLAGAGGGNQRDVVWQGSAAYDFSDKTVYLTADLDMGGVCDPQGGWSGPNWTPIGGKYPLSRSDSELVIEAFFNGVLDGRGHRIVNLFCDRFADKGYAYSQAVGLVGYLGELYDGEEAPAQPPAVRNLSVSGSVYGRRMVGGVVGRVGSIPTGVRIENCANYAAVRNTDSKGVGGVCGTGWGKGAIINCYNRGSVSTTYACPAGGICGSNSGLDIYNCYNTGKIDSNGNSSGRAIGGHNSGSYTVCDCWYLEGCDDDPASGGWYTENAPAVSVSAAARTDAAMRGEAFVRELNGNGAACVSVPGDYPVLRWEAASETPACGVTVRQPEGGSVQTGAGASVPAGTVLTLTNTPDLGWAFRYYTANGSRLSGPYVTVAAETEISGVFEPMQAGSLILPENPACDLTVRKNGTVMENGAPIAVTDYPMQAGDPLYENDVLTVRATLRDGAAPDDLSYVYSGLFRYRFAFSDGGEETATDTGVFTVTSRITGAALTVTAEPYTTHKVWTQLAETGWYNNTESVFTLRTARELAGFALLVKQGKDFAGKTVKLGNDISLSNDDATYNRSVRRWDGVGTNTNPFCGVFDGCGFTVSEMTAVADGSNGALFLYTDGATVKNLTVKGEVSANGGAAGVICRAVDTAVERCVNEASVDSQGEYAGGIVASADRGSAIEACENRGEIRGTTSVGGVAGALLDAQSTLTDCRNTGSVRGDGTSGGLGGVAGRIGGSVTRCANYGAVRGKNWYVGGVVGLANTQSASVLADCYNVGDVENTHGYAKAATGGVVGYGNYFSLKNGFCCAAVRGESGTVGGVIGMDSRRSTNRLENTAYLDVGCETAVGGVAEPVGVKALRAAELASQAYLNELNVNGCFALTNGKHPEFAKDPLCPGSVFADMPPQTHWAHAAIDWAILRGITAGTAADKFSPNRGCTRAQVVTFLWRAAGEPEPDAPQAPFADVRDSAYYYRAVLWAVGKGITSGTGADKFGPNAVCTRAQIVTFLWRFAGQPLPAADGNPFTDVKPGAYYEKAILWAAETGVTTGTSAAAFSPSTACTRAQIVTFLHRAIT